jgi:hypothetical protein
MEETEVAATGIGNAIVNLTIKETRNRRDPAMISREITIIVEAATPLQEVTLRREAEV